MQLAETHHPRPVHKEARKGVGQSVVLKGSIAGGRLNPKPAGIGGNGRCRPRPDNQICTSGARLTRASGGLSARPQP
eukprot:6254801-Pyramimonas_sp.AAC.1